MKLVRLIYVSTFDPKRTDIAEIPKIIATASRENPKHDITGMLVFGNDYFLQCLEGGREAVNRLYTIICGDKRHHHHLMLEYCELFERDFDNWSMKLVTLTRDQEKHLRRFSPNATFDPYLLSASSALKLMLSLRDAA